MRKIWMMALAICLIGLATAAVANARPQDQQPPAPANPPDQGAPPNGQPGRGGNVENRLEMMSKQLNLTDEQREKIRPILKHEVERDPRRPWQQQSDTARSAAKSPNDPPELPAKGGGSAHP